MTKGSLSKLMFIEANLKREGQDDECRIHVPPHPFSSVGTEKMALTLLSFSMQKTGLYSVNASNNVFYLKQDTTLHQVIITPGNYTTFAELYSAIHAALTITVTATTNPMSNVSLGGADFAATGFNTKTNQFLFNFTVTGGSDPVDFVFFHCKEGVMPVGVTPQGFYSESYQLLGGTPTTDVNNTTHGMLRDVSNNCVSSHAASLSTLDELYLRLNTGTNNFSSTGLDRSLRDSSRLIESQIFARIPITNQSFDELHPMVQYEDSGSDLYQSFVGTSSLDQLTFILTDGRGRPLSYLAPARAVVNALQFRAVLRWDLFVPPPPRQYFNQEDLRAQKYLAKQL